MIEAPLLAARRLAPAAALAEQGFLAAGQSLESAIGILDRLSRRFADYIAELTGEALAATRRDLAAAGRHVAALADAHRSDTAALAELGEIATAAGHRVAALQPIPQEVETLSLSARLVAGGMGFAGADFAAFAGNIRNAAVLARACLDQAGAALGQVDQDLTAARLEAAAFAQRHGPAMLAIPERLAENLRSLATQQNLAAEAATAAQGQSEAVRQRVAAQIFALQLGDITRQRLEHVQTATELLVEPQGEAGDLLAAQLNDAADELAREGEGIETGLRHLAQAAHAIGQLGLRVHGATRDGGFVAALEADIRQTAALFTELSLGDAATDRRMAAVLDAAGALTQRLANMQSVQEDIRILGLNATLKCGRLGILGRPLAAVAQELRLCSARFGTDAANVLQDLDRLAPIAARLRDPSRRGKHAELARATDELLAHLQRLDLLEHELAAALSQLQGDADAVVELVGAAVAQFAVRHALAETLRAAAGEFASWTTPGACGREIMDRIAAGYTMAREREIHARFAPLPHEASPPELADILF